MPAEPILIVDDNLINLTMVTALLEGEGYRVRTASDAEEALRVLEKYNPRLILMDLQLPGMDGLELTRRLKSNPATQDIVVLAVTAYAMKGDEQKALEAGCDGYVPKPIDTRSFPGIVSKHLSIHAGRE